MELKTRKRPDPFGLEMQDIDLAVPLMEESFAVIDDVNHTCLMHTTRVVTNVCVCERAA